MSDLVALATQLQAAYHAGNLLDMQDAALVLGVTNGRITHLANGFRTAPNGERLPTLRIGAAGRMVLPADLLRLWPDKRNPGLDALRSGAAAWAEYVQAVILPARKARIKSGK